MIFYNNMVFYSCKTIIRLYFFRIKKGRICYECKYEPKSTKNILTAESNNNVDVKSKISRFGSPRTSLEIYSKRGWQLQNYQTDKNKLALDSTETTEPKANCLYLSRLQQ